MNRARSTSSTQPDALDRLRSLYGSPGPFVSLYLPCGDLAEAQPLDVVTTQTDALRAAGVTDAAIDALLARLTLPIPEHMGGWALHAAGDGSTVADFASEGPAAPFVHVGALPMAAPLIEWDQWRVPHITVTISERGSELVAFIPGREPWIIPTANDPAAIATHCRDFAIEERLRLIVISGDETVASSLGQRLKGIVPPETRVVALDHTEMQTVEAVANSVVRYVADVVARDTVRALEDFRFLETGRRTVDGATATFAALALGQGDQLLIHDDPNDLAIASFGGTPNEISASPDAFANQARRADVAIWSAVSQGVAVRIIPSTGVNGPRENIGLMLPRAHQPIGKS